MWPAQERLTELSQAPAFIPPSEDETPSFRRIVIIGHQLVSAEKATLPARLGQFRIEVTVPGLDPLHEAGVLRAVKACLIHNTLIHAPAIETVVSTPIE